LGESRAQLVWLRTVNFDEFLATSLTADDPHLAGAHAERFGDRLLDGRVGLPFDGTRAHPHAQRAVGVLDTLGPGIRVGFDVEPQHAVQCCTRLGGCPALAWPAGLTTADESASSPPSCRRSRAQGERRLRTMSVGLQRRAALRNAEIAQLLQVALGLLAIWLGALELQAHSPPGQLSWAALDVLVHGAAAGLCAVWLVPAYGWRPLVSAIVAGIVIDLDHAVAARSLDPFKMMNLAARPPTHSLVAAVLFGVLAGRLLGSVSGYAVGIGIVAHLLGDAIEPAGVPLLMPFVANPRMQVPVAVLIGGMLDMALVSAWLSQRAKRPAR